MAWIYILCPNYKYSFYELIKHYETIYILYPAIWSIHKYTQPVNNQFLTLIEVRKAITVKAWLVVYT